MQKIQLEIKLFNSGHKVKIKPTPTNYFIQMLIKSFLKCTISIIPHFLTKYNIFDY